MKTYVRLWQIALPVLKMKTVSDEICRETQKHKIYVQPDVPENPVVYEITWKNMVQPYRPQMTI
jgi:hypothetical protein